MLSSLLYGLAHTTKCDNNTALFWKCLHFSSAILKHSTSLMMVAYFTLDIHSPSGYNGVLCRNESVTPANGSVTRISPRYAPANKMKDKAQQPLRCVCGYKLESVTQRRTSNRTCPSPARANLLRSRCCGFVLILFGRSLMSVIGVFTSAASVTVPDKDGLHHRTPRRELVLRWGPHFIHRFISNTHQLPRLTCSVTLMSLF